MLENFLTLIFFSYFQIFYALIDQTLFGDRLTGQRDTSSVVADLKSQYTSWRHVEGTHWQTRFSHLLNYGAGMNLFLSLIMCAGLKMALSYLQNLASVACFEHKL